MDVPRLSLGRTLLPIAPFFAVIFAPNLVFLDVRSHVENRPTKVTLQYADGRAVSESKTKDVKMVDLMWRLGSYEVSSSTTTERVFAFQNHCRTLEEAEIVALVRARSWLAVCVFPIAVVTSVLIGRVLHWHSRVTLQTSRFYPPVATVAGCLVILCACVACFALMKPMWPAGVMELVGWLRLSIAGVIPFASIVIITPISEELVFRSGLCRVLVERIGPVSGIFLQALLFASVHLATPLHVVVGFAGGLALGLVYIYCRSLSASIVLHAGANCILAVACLALTWP